MCERRETKASILNVALFSDVRHTTLLGRWEMRPEKLLLVTDESSSLLLVLLPTSAREQGCSLG